MFGGTTNLAALGTASGGADGLIDMSVLNGTNGFRVNGVQDGTRLGLSVNSAGDVNGDGIDDIIMGAPYGAAGGRSYLVFGSNSGFTLSIIPTATGNGANGYVFDPVATNTFDNLGWSVSGAGDVNDDGFDDLILGARNADPVTGASNENEGAAYLVYGGAANLGLLMAMTARSMASSTWQTCRRAKDL